MKVASGTDKDHGGLGNWDRMGQTLRTAEVTLKTGNVWYLVRGSGRAYAAINSHLVIAGPLHSAVLKEWDGKPGQWQWVNHNLSAYAGHRAHFEFTPKEAEIAVAMVVDSDKQPPPIWEQEDALAGHGNAERSAGILERECSMAAQGILLSRFSEFDPAIAKRVEGLGSVNAVVAYQPEFKFGSDLKLDGETNLYRVRIESGSDFGLTRALVAQTGAEILGYDEDLMVVAANGSFVDALAAVDDVASISNFALNTTQVVSSPSRPPANESAQDIIGANAAHALGYNGSTQIAAVSDTGLGGGTAATAHTDIPASRVVAIYNWPGATNTCFQSITNDGAIDVDSGHGTHTSGSVLGDGGVGGIGEGIAPAARLVFQATENWANISNYCQIFGGWPANGYFLTGLPTDLKTMYQQAYNAGARIHSNSWGSALAGDYTLDSANTDSFVWTNRDMVITFSAGNEGVDANIELRCGPAARWTRR
jgi:hypothetical protein